MNWNIRNKILGGFALALAALLAVGLVAGQNLKQLLASTEMRRQTNVVVLTLTQLQSSLLDAETAQRGYVITGFEDHLEPYHAGVRRADAQLRELRRLLAENAAQQRRLDQVEPRIAEKIALMKEKIDMRAQKTIEEVSRSMADNKGKQVMDEIRRIIGEMDAEEMALLNTRTQDSESAARMAQKVITIVTTLAFVVLALAGWMIARNIAQPLAEMTGVAERIAAGDLGVELAASARTDEVGILSRAFSKMCQKLQGMAGMAGRVAAGDLTADILPQSNQDALGQSFRMMTESLRGVMRDIADAVNVLGSSSREILAATAQLAATAAESAAAVAQTTTTVEEVKQTSQLSSQKAKYVSEQAQKVADVSQTGRRAVDQTIDGMNGIRQQMGAVAESILSLSAQGQAIGEIIATVDDLAAQSKLLAVNASIEAAKAGDEGKGFSVVAQEVRTLAEQSKQATTQVRGILHDIQKATSSAVLATEQATKTVENGVRQSSEAGASIGTLAENVNAAAQAAIQIAATSQEQFVGMDQVATAMENIKQASTQTVASTRQVEAAAQQLHELGQKLKELVARFKL